MTTPVLVLPALNEALALLPLLHRIDGMRREVPALGNLQVIVVDDGSTDGTAQVAESFPGTQVIRHPQNMGLAAGLKTGLTAAVAATEPGSPICVMDADDTHDPAALPLMLQAIARGADVVIGSRFAPGGVERGIPWHRKVFSRGAALLMTVSCGLSGVQDYTCGYRAYTREMVKAALAQDWVFASSGFSVTVGLLLAAARAGGRIEEVGVTVFYDRKPSKSTMRTIPTILGTLSAARTYRLLKREVVS